MYVMRLAELGEAAFRIVVVLAGIFFKSVPQYLGDDSIAGDELGKFLQWIFSDVKGINVGLKMVGHGMCHFQDGRVSSFAHERHKNALDHGTTITGQGARLATFWETGLRKIPRPSAACAAARSAGPNSLVPTKTLS